MSNICKKTISNYKTINPCVRSPRYFDTRAISCRHRRRPACTRRKSRFLLHAIQGAIPPPSHPDAPDYRGLASHCAFGKLRVGWCNEKYVEQDCGEYNLHSYILVHTFRFPLLTSSTIEGRGCNIFVPVLGGNGTKISPTGDISDQPPDQMR